MKKALLALTMVISLGFLALSVTPRSVRAQQPGPPGCLNECAPAAEQAFRTCINSREGSREACQVAACDAYKACLTAHEGTCPPAPGPVDPAQIVPFCATPDSH